MYNIISSPKIKYKSYHKDKVLVKDNPMLLWYIYIYDYPLLSYAYFACIMTIYLSNLIWYSEYLTDNNGVWYRMKQYFFVSPNQKETSTRRYRKQATIW